MHTQSAGTRYLCVCVCVFFPFILDIKFVGRTSRGHTGGRSHRISHTASFCGMCVCVCFLPIHSGHQVRWTYQPGSHRRKVTQDFSSTFFLRCVPLFFSREGFSHSFPSSTVKSNFVCVFCVFFPFILDFNGRIPAGVTQEEGNTGFSIHLLPAVLALIFLARRIQPFLSLVNREVEFCVLVLHPLGIFIFSF